MVFNRIKLCYDGFDMPNSVQTKQLKIQNSTTINGEIKKWLKGYTYFLKADLY